MWGRGPVPHGGLVPRFILEIERDGDDRVTGRLARDGRWPMPFSGWLELLQLLEDLADDSDTPFEGGGAMRAGPRPVAAVPLPGLLVTGLGAGGADGGRGPLRGFPRPRPGIRPGAPEGMIGELTVT